MVLHTAEEDITSDVSSLPEELVRNGPDPSWGRKSVPADDTPESSDLRVSICRWK